MIMQIPSSLSLRWWDTKINDNHDFTLYCYLRETVLKAAFAFGLACAVFRYWLLKVSSVNYLPSRSYMSELTVELYGVAC